MSGVVPSSIKLAWTRTHALLYRLSGGRVLARMGGQPVLLLRTVGRRTGRVRTTPVQYLPVDASFVVVAANAGAPSPPAWSLNLGAEPDASVRVGARDVAVLYRTNAQSRAIEDVFRGFDLPYQVVGGVSFYDRREVKDVLAYLRVLRNPVDSVGLQRILNIPPRGLGAKTQERLIAFAREHGMPPAEALLRVRVGGVTESAHWTTAAPTTPSSNRMSMSRCV